MKESNDPDFIISMMVQHLSSAEVQGAGCFTLATISSDSDAEKRAVAAGGGIEAVVRAMGAHGSSATLQEDGCVLLAILAILAENEALVAAKGGIEAVVRAMRANGSRASLQQQGCVALTNIAFSDPRLQAQVRAAGAVPLVEKALTSFPGDADLQTGGKQLLGKLVLEPKPRLPHAELYPPEVCCTRACPPLQNLFVLVQTPDRKPARCRS